MPHNPTGLSNIIKSVLTVHNNTLTIVLSGVIVMARKIGEQQTRENTRNSVGNLVKKKREFSCVELTSKWPNFWRIVYVLSLRFDYGFGCGIKDCRENLLSFPNRIQSNRQTRDSFNVIFFSSPSSMALLIYHIGLWDIGLPGARVALRKSWIL